MSNLVDQDISMVFGYGPTMYGVTSDGALIDYLSPSSDDLAAHFEMPGYHMEIVAHNGTFVDVGGELHFLYTVLRQAPDENVEWLDTFIGKISSTGTFDLNGPMLPSDDWPTSGFGAGSTNMAVSHLGTYYFELALNIPHPNGPLYGSGETVYEIFKLTDLGTIEQVSDLGRPGGSDRSGLVSVGDELYYIADQRHPLGNSELWRLNDDGTNEYIFVDLEGDVEHVASFAGQVWFVVENGQSVEAEIYRMPQGGTTPIHVLSLIHI